MAFLNTKRWPITFFGMTVAKWPDSTERDKFGRTVGLQRIIHIFLQVPLGWPLVTLLRYSNS